MKLARRVVNIMMSKVLTKLRVVDDDKPISLTMVSRAVKADELIRIMGHYNVETLSTILLSMPKGRNPDVVY